MNIYAKSLFVTGLIVSAVTLSAPSVGATSNVACIDGTLSSNLKVTWKSNNSVSVTTVGSKPLCADTTLFFSSYTAPDSYNGKGFADPSATPQTVFNSTSIVLKKDSIPSVNLSITLPEACKNKQVDVYYAPEVKNVNVKGHGAQFISGYLITKSVSECIPTAPPVTPVTPTTPIVPVSNPTPITPIITPVMPELPAELPKTGGSVNTTVAIATILSAITYAATYAFIKRA
ncbi:MAG: hypothetical protein ABIQ04_02770 [Candidatus Saccharimonadales bacterium]